MRRRLQLVQGGEAPVAGAPVLRLERRVSDHPRIVRTAQHPSAYHPESLTKSSVPQESG